MNFSLYHHRKLSDIISVPKGLPELMADLTKQVIKYQPQNIEEFLAGYLDALVQTRELIYVAETTVEDVLAHSLEVRELMRKANMTMMQASQCCEIIRNEFSKHLSKIQNVETVKELDIIKRLICECNLSVEQARKVAKIIEVSWGFFYHQNKTSMLKYNSILDSNSRNQTSKLKYNSMLEPNYKREVNGVNENVSEEEVEEAAIKIQSWFRRQKERQEFQLMQKSAIVIQAKARGYIQRKKMNKSKK